VTRETFEAIEAQLSDHRRSLQWDHPFLLPAWQQAWWRVFGRGQKMLLCGVRRQEHLLGIAPLMRQGQSARFIGNTEVFDYSDFVIARGREEEFFRVLIDYLRSRGILRLQLHGLRPDSTVMTVFNTIGRKFDCRWHVEQEDVTVELGLPHTWEDYLYALKSKQRHEIRRKFRRLYEAGRIDFRKLDPSQNLLEAVDTFLVLFNSNRRDKADFMTDDMAAYFRGLIKGLARIGLLRLYALAVEGVTAAVVMCCDYNNRRYLYNNSYDERFRRLNVGLLSKVLSIRDAIESGLGIYDFLRGDEVYKFRLGGQPTPIYNCAIDLGRR
jgi:CelD/BcsL family acetyltransferase involved in cellulose biosynthesis